MTTLTFDTYAAVKKLQAAGFTEQQAQAQTALLTELVESELATGVTSQARLRSSGFE